MYTRVSGGGFGQKQRRAARDRIQGSKTALVQKLPKNGKGDENHLLRAAMRKLKIGKPAQLVGEPKTKATVSDIDRLHGVLWNGKWYNPRALEPAS